MSSSQRYEIKFILDEGKLSEFLKWMHCFTGVESTFEPRHVNSLYFDDVSFHSVRDNLAGVSDRKKVRLRWYHQNNQNEISSLALELKIRQGRLGYKKKFPLADMEPELMSIEVGDIYERIIHKMGEAPELADILDDYYFPSLHVSYLREYFEDLSGLRITIDQDINFHYIVSHSKLFDDISSPYPMHIAELKFSQDNKLKVANLLRNLHMIPKRHSKYLVGLSIFGQALYV